MQKNVVEYLEKSYKKFPDKLAYADDVQAFTYNELRNFSLSLADELVEIGIVKKNIAIWLDRSVHTIGAFYAAMYSNNCYIPLESELGVERIKSIINSCKPKVLICNNETKMKALDILTQLNMSDVNLLNIDDIEHKTEGFDRVFEVMDAQIDIDPIYIVYTSGSSGTPKGVICNHRSVIDYIDNLGLAMGFDHNSVFANQSPLYIDACIKDVFSSLRCAGSTYIVPKSLFMFPIKLIEYLNDNKVNTICWVVSALSIVTMMKTFDKIKPKYIKLVTFGGEKFDTSQLNAWIDALPDATFYNLYGPTEATGMSMFYKVERRLEDGDILYIGKAFKNTEVFILNDAKLAELGESGDIYIRGTGVAMGYYGDDKRTAEAFVQNPLHNDYREIVYRTGDRGKYVEKDKLVFSGRGDNQIKHMGYRIELSEIENAVLKVCCVDKAVSLYDEVKKRIYLFYVGEIEVANLKKTIMDYLPRYMLPNNIVKLENMPHTNSGKIDRQCLKLKMEKKNG